MTLDGAESIQRQIPPLRIVVEGNATQEAIDGALAAIATLRSFKLTIKHLRDTGAGKLVAKLAKHADGTVAAEV